MVPPVLPMVMVALEPPSIFRVVAAPPRFRVVATVLKRLTVVAVAVTRVSVDPEPGVIVRVPAAPLARVSPPASVRVPVLLTANLVFPPLLNKAKLPVKGPPPPLAISAEMTLPLKVVIPPSPSFKILPEVTAEDVASRILPVATTFEVSLVRSPTAFCAPKTWKAEPVADPPMVKSYVVLAGEMTRLFSCQRRELLKQWAPEESQTW